VQQHDTDLLLTQTKYIYSILDKARMQGAKPNNTPMETSKLLSKFDGTTFEDPHLFRSIVGALQYITITRLDISFVVNRVAQYIHTPTSSYWAVV
jgi:hypothetical protein